MDRKEAQVGRGKKVPHKTFAPGTQEALDRTWKAQAQFRETCDCGYKVRGPNHLKGTHHKIRHPKIRRVT